MYNFIRAEMVKVINNYTLIDKIGQGNYGQVYRALNAKKRGEFAVKVIAMQKLRDNPMLEQCISNQIKTLQTIGTSEYIVHFEEHFVTKNNYYFVYQYCNEGTLLELIKREGNLIEKKALKVFRQLLEAFKVLNKFNIMHRDIKPQNIFFSKGKVKLGDFGFSKGLQPGEYMAKTMLGSPIYMAPEVLKGEQYTIKADIWSLGVVLYEMIYGDCPFKSNSIAMLINTISKSQILYPNQINPISQTTLSLLKKMLTKDYFRRINWVELFRYKIDQQGNYCTEQKSNPKTPSSHHQKSEFSIQQPKTPQQSNKFYSQKYMAIFTQPVHSGGSRGTERKISFLKDQVKQKEEDPNGRFYSSQRKIQSHSFAKSNPSKRNLLMQKHEKCLQYLKKALEALEKRQQESIKQSYLNLLKIKTFLKQITDDIKISETSLLDIASLINYEIILIDRQLVQTEYQLQKRKIDVPKKQGFSSLKILQDETVNSLEINSFIDD